MQKSVFTYWQTRACLSNVEEENNGDYNVDAGIDPLYNKHYHYGTECLGGKR